MKKTLFIAAVAVLVSVGAASARDLAPASGSPGATADSWSGFYAGVNGGYGWGNRTGCWDFAFNLPPYFTTDPITSCNGAPTSPVNYTFNYNQRGGLAGGQAGYNWTKDMLLFGIEASADWANVSGRFDQSLINFDDGHGHTYSLLNIGGVGTWNSIVDLTAKVGVAHPKWMAFAEGGWALANFSFKGDSGCDFNMTNSGLVAGAGIGVKLGKHWSVEVKYDHAWLAAQNASCTVDAFGGVPLKILTQGGIDTVKVALNYRFGG